MYVSQPSLSKQIAILENEIGVQLFYRTKRDVRLTPAGVVLFKELNGISELIERAVEKSRNPDLGESGTITIGCLEAMDTGKFLPTAVKKFKEKYPSVNVVFERHTFKMLREKFINGALDIIFTLSFEIDDSMGIIWENLYKQSSSIVMEASNPLANKVGLVFEDFKDENFVMLSRDETPNGFDGIIRLCRKHGFTPNIVKQLPNVESLLLCVESGLGIALVDSNIRMYNTENYKFFKLEDDVISVVMAWKKENMNPIVPLFTNNVLEEIKI